MFDTKGNQSLVLFAVGTTSHSGIGPFLQHNALELFVCHRTTRGKKR